MGELMMMNILLLLTKKIMGVHAFSHLTLPSFQPVMILLSGLFCMQYKRRSSSWFLYSLTNLSPSNILISFFGVQAKRRCPGLYHIVVTRRSN